jgi:xylulokinase
LGIPIQSISTEDAAAYGAAMLAVAASDDKRSIDEIAQSRISVSGTIYPDQRIISLYQKKYEKFKKYYPALKGLF